jgi:hypothetical protein
VALQWGLNAGRSWELIEGYDQGQTQVDKVHRGDMSVWAHPLDAHYVCKGLSGWPKLHLQVYSMDVHGRVQLCGYHPRFGHAWQQRTGSRPTALTFVLYSEQRNIQFHAAGIRDTESVLPEYVWLLGVLPAGGYGFCHVPTAPGVYELDCPTWLPEVRSRETAAAAAARTPFMGDWARCTASYMQHTTYSAYALALATSRAAVVCQQSTSHPSHSAAAAIHPTCNLVPLPSPPPPTHTHFLFHTLQGHLGERITQWFIGGAPRLRSEEVVYSPGDRFRLQTTAAGTVHVHIGEG